MVIITTSCLETLVSRVSDTNPVFLSHPPRTNRSPYCKKKKTLNHINIYIYIYPIRLNTKIVPRLQSSSTDSKRWNRVEKLVYPKNDGVEEGMQGSKLIPRKEYRAVAEAYSMTRRIFTCSVQTHKSWFATVVATAGGRVVPTSSSSRLSPEAARV